MISDSLKGESIWEFPRHNHLWNVILPTLMHDDLAHDWLHVKRVTEWCIKIAQSIDANIDLAGAAGLLHDIINIPKESNLRSMGSSLSAQAGVHYLQGAGYSDYEIDIVTDAIATCSWSRGLSPTNEIGKVLQDADRIDAIGALGLLRNIACAQAMSSRKHNGMFYNPENPVPWDTPTDMLNDKDHALDHFFCKLLKLKSGMHTDLAKEEAERRHNWMIEFLKQVEYELR